MLFSSSIWQKTKWIVKNQMWWTDGQTLRNHRYENVHPHHFVAGYESKTLPINFLIQ